MRQITLSYDGFFWENYLLFEEEKIIYLPGSSPFQKKKNCLPFGNFLLHSPKIYPSIHRSENNIQLKRHRPLETLLHAVWVWAAFSHVDPQRFFLVDHFTENHSQRRTKPRIANTLWSKGHFIKALTTDEPSAFTSPLENLPKVLGGEFTSSSETPMRWCLVCVQ